MVIGHVIGGRVGEHLIIRLKNDSNANVGDLLVCEDKGLIFYLKIIDKMISSSIPSQFIEEISGQELELDKQIELFDDSERFYPLAYAKILRVKSENFSFARTIPSFFSRVRKIKSSDLEFMKASEGVDIGHLRVGADCLKDIIVKLPAKNLVSHHVLISAATGKGKSNFTKVFVRGLMKNDFISCIIIDPHCEYYGSKGFKGLSSIDSERIEYFTSDWKNHFNSIDLRIHSQDLVPTDFFGITELSDAQKEAMDALYKNYNNSWIRALLVDEPINVIWDKLSKNVSIATLYALKRRINYTLELEDGERGLAFDLSERRGASIFQSIQEAVCRGKIIILDTSMLGSEAEKLVSSSIVRRVFGFYRKSKQINPESFNGLPEVMIIFEEAPRVLGIEALSHGSNVFEKISREGRKFKVGLCAITQMPSLIPKEILSQMNTKVILGMPSISDRNAVIESSSQNIGDEGPEIQILDKGEAIITSPFIDFPMPVKIFNFDELCANDSQKNKKIQGFGI
ncbi:MAG: ATP-binding protein [Candidatus Nanoarchaeia archaeon]|nr:ATP-binding protein [Candidatus Nanoarchaeia archaeon]MDD5053957.1 ATP-binding protein [Candidatus Nanoarchaeia archaeon]